MLEVRRLSVSYGRHRALDGIDLHVGANEIVVVLGGNGAGKSTLLAAVAGIREGTVQGEILLDGADISAIGADEIVERGIAFVPEGRGIFGEMSVAENLALGAYCDHARAARDSNLQRVYALFPKLRERRAQVARTMSGGEQQMVAIGRALMADPRILMLDEPSLGLSPLLCTELFGTLARIRQENIGILLVEQNARQSLAIGDRCYLIENGALRGEGDARAMLDDPAVQAAYLGGAAAKVDPVAPGVAAPLQTAALTFIEPGAAGERTRPARGGEIEALVARAAARSRHTYGRPVREAAPPAAAPTATGSPAPEAVARLNAEFEAAARNARLSRPRTPSGSEQE